jgi:DNA (cytosine-5)-methyltransferase 1
MQCVGQVEIDPFCQKVLKKHWPNVKRIGDIKNVKGDEFGTVELICGGFPCQPFSVAGKRKGETDNRFLWPEMVRVIAAIRPSWVLCENVAGIISMALDKVHSDLESIGYTVQSFIIPACAVGAIHRRDRVWIVGNTESNTIEPECEICRRKNSDSAGSVGNDPKLGIGIVEKITPDTNVKRLQRHWKHDKCSNERTFGTENWERNWVEVAAELCRVDDGVSRKLDRTNRLKALGNAVVPQIVEIIGRCIMYADAQEDDILPAEKPEGKEQAVYR